MSQHHQGWGAGQAPCVLCGHPLGHPMQQTPRGWMHPQCAYTWGQQAAPAPRPGSLAKKGCAVAFGIGMLALFIIAKVVEAPSRKDAPAAARVAAPITYTVAAEWTKDSAMWEAIVVPRGTSDAQICALARWLHKEKWLARFQFFDDSARVSEYVAWTKAYPAYQRPKPLVTWMGVHHRGLALPATTDTWEFRNVTADAPGALRTSYPCSFPR